MIPDTSPKHQKNLIICNLILLLAPWIFGFIAVVVWFIEQTLNTL